MKVSEIVAWLDRFAPFETQLEYDNSGLLVGDPEQEITGIHLALDCTGQVLAKMKENGSNLLITHHPLMFSPIRRILITGFEGALIAEMIRSGISMIASHTCLDQAPGGVNDALANRIGLLDVTGSGFVRVGDLPAPMKAPDFAAALEGVLGDRVRLMGDPELTVSRVGLCSGAGGEEWRSARELGADAFVTGEMKHHLSLEANAGGVICFECGHAATERPGIEALWSALQREPFVVESNLRVTKS